MPTKIKIAVGVQALGMLHFNPKSVPNLKTWHDGDLGVYNDLAGTVPAANGNVVRLWKDQSGNGNDINQTNNSFLPHYLVQNVNGHSAVQFDAGDIGNQCLQKASVSGISQPITVYSVHYIDENVTTAVNRTIWCDAVSTPYFFQAGSTGKLTLASGATLQEANPRGNHAWVICSVILNGASSKIYANGVLVASGNAGSSSPTGLSLGAQGGASELGGRIAINLIYAGAHSDSTRATIETWLGARFAITLG